MKTDIRKYIGQKYGMLTIVGLSDNNAHPHANHWTFKCDCGKEFDEVPNRVLSGHKKSCGCHKGKGALTHGCNGDPFYPTWWGMMRRCYHKSNHNYERYGGRGITVCDEWHDPSVFIVWARSTFPAGHEDFTLDRINNDMEYSPENCRWVSAKTQANNRRSNVLETINGKTKTLSEWCTQYNIKPETVRARQKAGMDFETALTTPVKSHR